MERRVLRIYVNDLGKVAVDHRGARTEDELEPVGFFAVPNTFDP
jgi:hypothetical protein